MHTYKRVKDFEWDDDMEALVKAFLKTASPTSWFVVNYGEGGGDIYECPTKKDVEGLLTAFHIEGSHTDHDIYEVYHNGKKYNYEVSTTIK